MNDKDYQVPFRFTGKIDKLTFKLGPTQLAAADQKVIEESSRQSQRLGGLATAAKRFGRNAGAQGRDVGIMKPESKRTKTC